FWQTSHTQWDLKTWDHFFSKKCPKASERKSHNDLGGELEILKKYLNPKSKESRKVHKLKHQLKKFRKHKGKKEKENLASPSGSQALSLTTEVVKILRKKIKKERRKVINLMRQEIKELREEKIEKVSYSTVSSAQFSSFCMQSGFIIQSLEYKGNLPRKDIPAFNWSKYAENFVEQRENILNYLEEHLGEKLPRNVIISEVASERGFLNTYGNSPFPFHTVDALVKKAGVRAVIELKKIVKSSHIKQIILEMIAADLFVRDEIKVFGLLTDLKSAWHFFWLEEGKKIMTVKMTHRNKALDFACKLADVYRDQSKEVNLIGLQKVQRVKIREL
ncbi:22063_t:CDS:2, partial [Rhizophagus irregularis]